MSDGRAQIDPESAGSRAPPPPPAGPSSREGIIVPPRKILRQVGQAIEDFQMIRPGDRLLLGLSGGKDSLSLLHALLVLQGKTRRTTPFEIATATVDPCIEGFDPSFLKDYVPRLGIAHHYERQHIVLRAQNNMQGDSFCAYCARMRRGILYACARRHGYNVLVLAQHLDDLAESFLMNAFHGGALRTMKAHYVIDAGDLRLIRPAVYVRERQFADFAARAGLPAIRDNCPACFRMPSERFRIKQLLADEERLHPLIFPSLRKALKPLMAARAPLHWPGDAAEGARDPA